MILKLSVKDLLHEWLLSLCLVLAITSIISPLLILFGIKFGTIETLRGRLVEDPKNREIRPMISMSFQKEWFSHLRESNPEVAFVIPMTRQISTSVLMRKIDPASQKRLKGERISLIATGKGDPLLLDNGYSIPEGRGCVLTTPAAEVLNVVKGDRLQLAAGRVIKGKQESGQAEFEVQDIMDARASDLKAAYVNLEVVEAIEDYKDGRAVPEFGWPGSYPNAYPVYNGAIIHTPSPLSPLQKTLLVNNTGFIHIAEITTQEEAAPLGFTPHKNLKTYFLRTAKRPADEENIAILKEKLRGTGALLFPWNPPADITLKQSDPDKSAMETSLSLYSFPGENAALATQWQESLNKNIPMEHTVFLPISSPLHEGLADLTITVGGRTLTMPVNIRKRNKSTIAYAAANFSGKLNLLHQRFLKYDVQSQNLLVTRNGYAGFRLYTKSIDDVAGVQQKLENQGIAVHTERKRIEEVRQLNQYMTLIFWLIALVGVLGAMAALGASLFASVQRKKRELNVLRLLGVTTGSLVRFPIYQGLFLAMLSFSTSLIIFSMVSLLINRLLGAHLQLSESLCTLAPQHILLLFLSVASLTILSAGLAALQATRLDPAEALRDE
ncbi:ABC transporter permease [Desulfogranum japonicum]|uniref:ABC transporter permease n=1 Tax=Desulfogranum japonicum TaxID=231447 RepID=UPI000413FFB3|nr:FtsX-like permease family protein [Desulfogranum japonicum]